MDRAFGTGAMALMGLSVIVRFSVTVYLQQFEVEGTQHMLLS
jgi:hypothetical protein